MKKLIILFFIFFTNNAFAQSDEEFLCGASRACKKVCDSKRNATYSDLNPDDQKLMMKCIDDLNKKIQNN